MKSPFALALVAILAVAPVRAADNRDAVKAQVDALYPDLRQLYEQLHAQPELSFQEAQTAATVAAELRRSGYEVTTNVGGHGLVAVWRNGPGPTVLVRTDLDALPVPEQTGLPYASKRVVKDEQGKDVPVMHACGHDIHMTSLIGTARVLKALKDRWSGTLVLIGQPAEERGGGAKAMLADKLFERFPKPDYCLALHVTGELPAGMVAYVEGYAMANVDSVDITVRGVGGHGAYPHLAKDPVVLASQIVLALQTVVSRETAPNDPAVVTVGSIHGGTKHNVIPDEVKLQLTLRSYTDEVREKTIASIRRITQGLGQAAGLPEDRMPLVKVSDEFTPALYNTPALAQRLSETWKQWLGEGNVVKSKPVMGGEDFGRYGRTADKIPICLYWVGATTPETVMEARKHNKTLPSIHSPFFAPAPEPTLKTGITTMTASVLELLGKK
ncbi:MAG TPA: amidohydrolase [Roseimicrobium sp.]|nr:amidohydrolase [Roseimicrobium sp.]